MRPVAVLLPALLAALAPASVPASQAALPVVEPHAIADGVALIAGGFAPGRQPDGNTVVFRGGRGLVVFDTGRHPEHSQAILEYAHASGLPILAVANSHWHLDHVSGNPRLRAKHPGLTVYATNGIDGALVGFLAKSRRDAQAFLAQPGDPALQAEVRADVATIDSGRAIAPDVVVERAGRVDWGGRALQVGVERHAVTEGDLWLFDEATATLAAGDLVTLPVPFLDTACPANWSAALGRLESVRFERLVPGHGPLLDRAGFTTWRTAFDALLACAGGDADASQCRDGWIRDAGGLMRAEATAPRTAAMLGYYVGLLRDPAARARHCDAPVGPSPPE
jgi:glyoxylase-like metal-dependent hydrolase (beta-lactamase superfamily II)